MVKKRLASATGGQLASVDEGSFFEGRYPLLESHLCDLAYDDGSPRVTSTLLLFVENGVWKGCLCARDSDEVAFVSGSCTEELLTAFEVGLDRGVIDWRKRAG